MNYEEAVRDFLAQRRIAVAGVARGGDTAANTIYRKLRAAGYEVVPLNPKASLVEGDPCYADLGAVPGGVDAVVVATPPEATADVVRAAAASGVRHVWIHRGIGRGSYDADAVAMARQLGLAVIPDGCPMMFCEPVDVAHRCLRWWQRRRAADAASGEQEAAA